MSLGQDEAFVFSGRTGVEVVPHRGRLGLHYGVHYGSFVAYNPWFCLVALLQTQWATLTTRRVYASL